MGPASHPGESNRFPKRLLLWGLGFAVLFLVNAIVELLVLPVLQLDDTSQNDLYFQLWWIVVAAWLLFGLAAIDGVQRLRT